jgi:hypothetical protein
MPNNKTALLTDTQRLKQALMFIVQDTDGVELADLAEMMMGNETQCYYGMDNTFALEVVLPTLPDDAAGTLRPN